RRPGVWFKRRAVLRRPQALLLGAGALLPLFLGLTQEIQEVDPTQYAEVARRMAASGDPLHLSDNFGPFLNKPPLTLWLMVAAFRCLGVGSLAVRLPSLIAVLALAVVVYRLGQRLWDETTGLIAAVFVTGSICLQQMVLDPKVDAWVTCLTT